MEKAKVHISALPEVNPEVPDISMEESEGEAGMFGLNGHRLSS
jgi:hypothetical protein